MEKDDFERAIEAVKTMEDIDGYSSGDCVRRRAVIAILNAARKEKHETD